LRQSGASADWNQLEPAPRFGLSSTSLWPRRGRRPTASELSLLDGSSYPCSLAAAPGSRSSPTWRSKRRHWPPPASLRSPAAGTGKPRRRSRPWPKEHLAAAEHGRSL